MSHDPLCDSSGFFPPDDCDDCDLIAEVRADERKKVLTLGLLYAARVAATARGETS